MPGYAILRPSTAFALSGGRKRPRKTDDAHLRDIRTLPCVVCLGRPVEAAHIRTVSMQHGKRETGKAEKPDDKWVLPLCPSHHREQHEGNELAFYLKYGIDPFGTALALWGAKEDPEAMQVIVTIARKR